MQKWNKKPKNRQNISYTIVDLDLLAKINRRKSMKFLEQISLLQSQNKHFPTQKALMQRIGTHEKSFNKMVNTINNSLDLDSNEQLSYSKQIGFEGLNISFHEKGNVYIKVPTAILRYYGLNKSMGYVLWYFQSLSLNNNSKGVFYGSTLKLANRINLVLEKIGMSPISFTSIYRAVKVLQQLNLIEYDTKVKYKNGQYKSFSKITFDNNVILNLCENLEQSKLNDDPPNLLQRIIKDESITLYKNKKDDINGNWKNAFEGLLD